MYDVGHVIRIIAVAITVLILFVGCGQMEPTPSPTAAPMTAERLIDECARAMGGVEKIAALETLRSTQHFPDHENLICYEIKRPNRVRMGDQLVFDGKRASWLTGELVPQEEWKDFEVDIAWYIPAFFDYPAEYMGTGVVNGIETHVLQVPLPLGAVMTYNLDAQTYLVYRASARLMIDHKEFNPERIYSDYRVQDGILYPHAFTYGGRTGVFTATMETLEFNVPLEDERFAVPIADEFIAFYSERDGNAEIYVMAPDGSHLQRLTNAPGDDMTPAVSPDGRQIAFNSERDGNGEIYVMNTDGSDQRRLTDMPTEASQPAWSPDGARIAFVSGPRATDIYVMNADGSDLQHLTDTPVIEWRPVWSPDGARIMFNSDRDGDFEIYVMDADGGNVQQITDTPHWDMFAQWSPDGKQIAYAWLEPNGWMSGEIHVMDADGTHDRQLTDLPACSENAVWSPDGSQIVFQTYRDGNFEIYVMNADGSDQRRLTNDPGNDYWPSWGKASPGGPTATPSPTNTPAPPILTETATPLPTRTGSGGGVIAYCKLLRYLEIIGGNLCLNSLPNSLS
jgi:TolB protein